MTSPVQPDAGEARRWAEEELSKPEYNDGGGNWLQRILEWISNLNTEFNLGGGSINSLGIIGTIVVIALLVALVIWLVRSMPRGRSRKDKKRRRSRVFEDDDRPAEQILSAAEAAAARGDWTVAVIEMYRTLVRSLEDRDVLEDRPAMTAHEAAVEAGALFRERADDLLTDAEAFERAYYGHFHSTRRQYEHVRATHNALAAGKPVETPA